MCHLCLGRSFPGNRADLQTDELVGLADVLQAGGSPMLMRLGRPSKTLLIPIDEFKAIQVCPEHQCGSQTLLKPA